MNWSDLPQEIQDLEKGFSKKTILPHFHESDSILFRFHWKETPQGFEFWSKCYCSDSLDELPDIPINQKY